MPLVLKFKSKRDNIKTDSREAKDFAPLILQIPSIVHQGASTSVISNHNGNVVSIEMKIHGITVIDKESLNMLESIIFERLNESDSPFYLSECSQFSRPNPGEAVFLHERFKPIISKNARDISHIERLEIPQKFCCSISNFVMDRPVYDIRSPHILYDNDVLMYWINKSQPKLMPHTNLPFDVCFMKVDYSIQSEIINFIKTTIDSHENEMLNKILLKYECQHTNKTMNINHALLKSSGCEDDDIACIELRLLRRSGADINYQDPINQETPLHRALKKLKLVYVTSLLYCGAKIDLQDHLGNRAFDLIGLLQNSGVKDSLRYICKKLGLLTVSSTGELTLPTKSNYAKPLASRNHVGSPVTAAGDAHTLLLQKLNVALENDANRSELTPIEQSIKDHHYAQALRRACTVVNIKRVFLLVEILLEFKDKLNININEQNGPKKFAAIHHAATKAAISGDHSLYDLLVKNGANKNLQDADKITASQHLSNIHSAKASI